MTWDLFSGLVALAVAGWILVGMERRRRKERRP
jgi:hypothetical protein